MHNLKGIQEGKSAEGRARLEGIERGRWRSWESVVLLLQLCESQGAILTRRLAVSWKGKALLVGLSGNLFNIFIGSFINLAYRPIVLQI